MVKVVLSYSGTHKYDLRLAPQVHCALHLRNIVFKFRKFRSLIKNRIGDVWEIIGLYNTDFILKEMIGKDVRVNTMAFTVDCAHDHVWNLYHFW